MLQFLHLQDLPAFVPGLIRHTAWLMILVVIFMPLEHLFAVRPRKVFSKSVPGDLCFYFISGIVPHLLLIVPSVGRRLCRLPLCPVARASRGRPMAAVVKRTDRVRGRRFRLLLGPPLGS